ncbi:MAG: YwiC-like family protein [Nitrospinota bacterium]|nr:YwiC-like family protein [Nitrospinota bacterium]
MYIYLTKPVIPKEHGAWPVLIIPILAGSLAVTPAPSFDLWAMAALLASALFGFLAASTMRVALNPPPKSARERFIIWAALYGILAGAPFLYLVTAGQRPALAWFIIPAGLLTLAYFWSSSIGAKRTLPFETAGLFGLAMGGPAAVYLQQGALTMDAALMYPLCLIWFMDRMITARRTLELMRKGITASSALERASLFSAELLTHAAALALVAMAIIISGKPGGWALIIPFLAATARNAFDTLSVAAPTDPMKVGFSEMRLGIAFCILLIIMWRV